MDSISTQPAESNTTADRVEIVYYTDPLCCWSWALEPQWRKLRYQYRDQIKWRYCMGGLLPGWNHFSDSVNSVNRPAQMGPIWMEAAHLSGMPINNRIWMDNAPASSYLACIAVKCAELQSVEIGEQYLRLLREAIMIHGHNIALQSVLLKVAGQLLETSNGAFNAEQFQEDLIGDKGIDAFRKDLMEVQSRGINRFPTLIFNSPHHPPLLTTGCRSYAALTEVLRKMIAGIEAAAQPISEESYTAYWGTLTKRELEEAIDEHGVLKKFTVSKTKEL